MEYGYVTVVGHLGLPGVLRHSAKLRASTHGYIAERASREELLDLAGIMTSTTQ
jgi:hypothetical protein